MVGIICVLIEIELTDLIKSGERVPHLPPPLPPVPTVLKEGRARGERRKKMSSLCAPLTLEKKFGIKTWLDIAPSKKATKSQCFNLNGHISRDKTLRIHGYRNQNLA